MLSKSEIANIIECNVQRYISEGQALDAWHINNGLCEDFAMDVINQITSCRETDDVYLEWGDAHIHLLAGLNVAHAWIVAWGHCYDAELPNGTDKVLELPFFQRQLNKQI